MNRHQRRKRHASVCEARKRQEIVRRNLSTPVERIALRGRQISGVYDNEMDRARGRGVTPMSRPHGRKVLSCVLTHKCRVEVRD